MSRSLRPVIFALFLGFAALAARTAELPTLVVTASDAAPILHEADMKKHPGHWK